METQMQSQEPHKTAKILVAEDSPTQAISIQELLLQSGLEVVWARNGIECLELVNESHPDLILLDLEMPEMNGLQTCRALKQSHATADIPIIIFTRHDDPEFARLSFQTGAVDYIPKDVFANRVLLETLRDLGFIQSGTEINGKTEEREP
jgi:putative two-component system response regulator